MVLAEAIGISGDHCETLFPIYIGAPLNNYIQ